MCTLQPKLQFDLKLFDNCQLLTVHYVGSLPRIGTVYGSSYINEFKDREEGEGLLISIPSI